MEVNRETVKTIRESNTLSAECTLTRKNAVDKVGEIIIW